MKLQLLKGSTEHGLCPKWPGVQTSTPNFERTLMRESFFKVFCWLRCLSKWGVGPLKRGSHLSAQGQQSCSGQPHCASLIVKKLRFSAPIWSGWGNCRLSATVMTQSFWNMQCITTIMQYFTRMPMQYIGQLLFCNMQHMFQGVKMTGQIGAGGVTWLAVEKLSITAWKVLTPQLAGNISMKYSPDWE